MVKEERVPPLLQFLPLLRLGASHYFLPESNDGPNDGYKVIPPST